MPECSTFFAKLSADHTELVLENLLMAPRIEHKLETVLSCVAEKHTEAVWNFLGRRLSNKREQEEQERYEAIPYQFHRLGKPLSTNAKSATEIVRSWYDADDTLFRFRGARLLSAVFPDFPPEFANQLSQLVAAGSDDDLGFVLSVLQCYEGEPATHDVIKQLIARVPDEDPILANIENCLESTGAVWGDFGIADAFRSKKAGVSSWIADERPRVKAFADRFTRKLDNRIASEQREAEQWKELRRREFDSNGAESQGPAEEQGEPSY